MTLTIVRITTFALTTFNITILRIMDYVTLSITTFSIMILSIISNVALSVAHDAVHHNNGLYDTQHK
jgi:hypothetical protein